MSNSERLLREALRALPLDEAEALHRRLHRDLRERRAAEWMAGDLVDSWAGNSQAFLTGKRWWDDDEDDVVFEVVHGNDVVGTVRYDASLETLESGYQRVKCGPTQLVKPSSFTIMAYDEDGQLRPAEPGDRFIVVVGTFPTQDP